MRHLKKKMKGKLPVSANGMTFANKRLMAAAFSHWLIVMPLCSFFHCLRLLSKVVALESAWSLLEEIDND
jgi:hypothetical protein